MSSVTSGDDPTLPELNAGDVVVIDRSVGDIETRTFATVIETTPRGPRVAGPDYPVATYANALKIDAVTRYGHVIGRDGVGAFHLFDHTRDRLDVVAAPGESPEHSQTLTDRRDLIRWVAHVDDCRGWDELAGSFVDVIDGGESA